LGLVNDLSFDEFTMGFLSQLPFSSAASREFVDRVLRPLIEDVRAFLTSPEPVAFCFEHEKRVLSELYRQSEIDDCRARRDQYTHWINAIKKPYSVYVNGTRSANLKGGEVPVLLALVKRGLGHYGTIADLKVRHTTVETLRGNFYSLRKKIEGGTLKEPALIKTQLFGPKPSLVSLDPNPDTKYCFLLPNFPR
jgi:hypothetical protein